MVFTPQQKAQCVVWFAQMGSSVAVQRQYARHYGLEGRAAANVPDSRSIKRCYDKYLERTWKRFEETKGENKVIFRLFSFQTLNFRWVRTELKVEEVLERFCQNDQQEIKSSKRQIAREFAGEISRRSIDRILKENKFHSYKMQLRQQLTPLDQTKRINHAIEQLGMEKWVKNHDFLKNEFLRNF